MNGSLFLDELSDHPWTDFTFVVFYLDLVIVSFFWAGLSNDLLVATADCCRHRFLQTAVPALEKISRPVGGGFYPELGWKLAFS